MKKYLSVLLLLFFQLNAQAADKLTVLLDWFPNPNHAPLFVADMQGYFQAENLAVTMIGPADPADPPKLVAAGYADIAITYEPQFIQQVDQGLPLVRVGTLIDQPLQCIVTIDPAIDHLTDLKHKLVGSPIGDTNSILLKTMLRYHDLALNDIEHISVHYNLTPSLLAKKIDAASGMMRNFEMIQIELAGATPHAFYPEKNGVPIYDELILVTNKKNSQDTRIPRFLYALQRGVTELHRHPETMWQKFILVHPELNNTLNHRAWFATLPFFANQPGQLHKQQWQDFIHFMQKNALVSHILPLNAYAIELKGSST